MTTEWNAAAYHHVSDPQFGWGVRVLDRLPLDGREHVIDAGCGSGRLSAELAARLPRGRLTAVDRSRAMLQAARQALAAAPCPVGFVLADLADAPFRSTADAVFSTATFHWVLDHERLFAGLHRALRPGGRLAGQCGGHGNLDRVHRRAKALIASPRWRDRFLDWREPWEFATPDTTAARLARAGFTGVRTWREDAPTTFDGRASFEAFVTTVVLRAHLARLPDERARQEFVGEIADHAGRDDPPYTLDYVRLNIEARRR